MRKNFHNNSEQLRVLFFGGACHSMHCVIFIVNIEPRKQLEVAYMLRKYAELGGDSDFLNLTPVSACGDRSDCFFLPIPESVRLSSSSTVLLCVVTTLQAMTSVKDTTEQQDSPTLAGAAEPAKLELPEGTQLDANGTYYFERGV